MSFLHSLASLKGSTEYAKEAKGCIATPMDDVLLSIFIMRKTPYLPGTLKSFLAGTQWNKDDLKRLSLIN